MSETPRARRSNRRRGKQSAPVLDTTVPSPCLSVCRFDGEPYCRGCYRNIDEIREWIVMTREQKLDVLESIAQRRKAESDETVW